MRIPAGGLNPTGRVGAGPASTEPQGVTFDSWNELRKLAPGMRVAVYLENGGRMVQKFQSVSDAEVVLDIGAVKRQEVVAVAVAPDDRLLNGVLTGAAIGVGVGLGYARAFTDDGDFSGTAAAVGIVYGLAGGSGIGALLDAGTATRERPVYLRAAPATLSGTKHWKLEIPGAQLHNWISGRKVELMLRDGSYLKGRAVAGNERIVRVAVGDASDRSLRGQQAEIPVDRVGAVYYRFRIGGNRFAATLGGALTGLFTGTLLGGSIHYDQADETGLVVGAGLGLILGASTGLGLAEYYNVQEITLLVK